MIYNTYGNDSNPRLLLIPGLGVSYEIFLPLIENLKDRFHIVAAGIDGFLIGKESAFTSVDDQAGQIIKYVQENLGGQAGKDSRAEGAFARAQELIDLTIKYGRALTQ